VPPRYGGFETFAAELGKELVGRGHRVAVYCRSSLYPDGQPLWEGIQRIDLPAMGHKYFETVSHAFLSSIDALRRGFDVVLLCNAANAFVLPLLRAARLPVAINVDGIERRRRKWNPIGRAVYSVGEVFSVAFASEVIADAEVIARYYEQRHGVGPRVITYGSEFPVEDDSDVLSRLKIEPQKYLLYVSRFEPENNPLEVIRAFRKVETTVPLVMVGSAPYAAGLDSAIRRERDERVLLPGAIYGVDYRTLQRNALAYIQATEIGGTHPALIEAMGSGGAVLANDTPENREVGGDAVMYFRLRPHETLSEAIQGLLDAPAGLRVYRERSQARARERYSWKTVADEYEKLFFSMAGP
jgi:glycosyltransferase involved in cell wall biosynthesis